MNEALLEQMQKLINRLDLINESPYLHDSELFYFETAMISKAALQRSYTHFGTVLQEIEIFEKNNRTAFVVGLLDDKKNLIHFLDIQIEDKTYQVKPKQLSSNYRQVGAVIISENAAQQGITRAVYSYLVNHFDILSDSVQYLGGKRLLQSLARNSICNIYVFDGNINDYLRDQLGNIINYNGENINEDYIWGQSNEHEHRILVASKSTKN